MRRRASGGFELPVSASVGIGFFTPEGERRWVPDWEPEYLHRAPDDGVDTAFRTRHGGEETLWMVLEHDPEDGCLGYARVTPESRLGTVATQDPGSSAPAPAE